MNTVTTERKCAIGWPLDAAITVALGLVLLLWDFSGLDAALTRSYGSAAGFAWREQAWTAGWVHQGGRVAAALVFISLLLRALSTPAAPDDPSLPTRRQRLYWWGICLLCLLLVPALKQISSTSCPWDLAEFGGRARWVSHWQWGRGDGGPGHCFPSGHAVAAFAFWSQYFMWRSRNARRARLWLLAVALVGSVFTYAQLARGAHHFSHGAWSAWLCWALCCTAAAARPVLQRLAGALLACHHLQPPSRNASTASGTTASKPAPE